jgi:hypothetical protein
MAMRRIATLVQQSVLSQCRVAPALPTAGTDASVFTRYFASGYLDRNQVTERILTAVKGFDKVDGNKVRDHDVSIDSCSASA